MFALCMYLKGKNPAAKWSSQIAFNDIKATNFLQIFLFFLPLSLTQKPLLCHIINFTFGLDFMCAGLSPLNDFNKAVQD